VSRRKVAWLTYAWADDAQEDVRYVAQELDERGLTVRIDKYTLIAGKPLWRQIEAHIASPDTDGWIFYATAASLSSRPCQEEYGYALDRALHARGDDFPIIGLFPAHLDRELIPAGIRIRPYVMLNDHDRWERIIAAVSGQALTVAHQPIKPYQLTCYHDPLQPGCVIEVRPRIDTWGPIAFAVPVEEDAGLMVVLGTRGQPPTSVVMSGFRMAPSSDGKWFIATAGMQATPNMSIYAFCRQCPSRFAFGQEGGPMYTDACPSLTPEKTP